MTVDLPEIVDIHPHTISGDAARYPFDPVGGKRSAWTRHAPDGDALASMMEQAGIRRAVIVHASSAYGYDNAYAADVAAAHADRFRFVGALDVQAPDAAERLAYWVKARGMVGFRIFAAGAALDAESGAWLADAATFPAWETARELHVPVCIQTRFNRLPMVRTLLERFPDVKIILDHFARPPVEDGPPYAGAHEFFALAAYPNLYLKLTEGTFAALSTGRATARSFLERTVAEFGADRIAWGSNFPQSPGTLIELRDLALRELAFLSDRDRRSVFAGTARALYPTVPT